MMSASEPQLITVADDMSVDVKQLSEEAIALREKEEKEAIAFDKLVNEEHRVWKKNTPLLYDVVMTHALSWPSLTCSWLPDVVSSPENNYEEHRLLLGTHTSAQEQNYLLIASLRMPNMNTEDGDREGEGEPNVSMAEVPKFDSDKAEYGGYGCSAAKIKTTQKINHKNEVHKASYMPQNPCLIATKGPHPEVMVFDYTKHPSEPPSDGVCRPDIVLHGHTSEGYELSWNPCKTGQLVSAGDNGLICLFDVTTSSKNKTSLNAVRIYHQHTDVCEDVQFHNSSEHLFGSVGDDMNMILWDSRAAGASFKLRAHDAPVNSLAWHPFSEYVFATASADSTVALWDMRKMKVKLHSFVGHQDEVFQLQWSSFDETVLASGSLDRRTMVWDISRIGHSQTQEQAKEGPPELMFIHGGHLGKLTDFAWNPHMPRTAATVAYDNMIQIWQIADDIYNPQANSNGSKR
eukprot:CFRG7935T1